MPTEQVTLVASVDLANNGYGNTGRHWRVVVSPSQVISNAVQIRVLVDCVSSWSFSSMYVGHKGAGTHDFDGTQVPVTFGGSPGITVSEETWSDWVDYTVDASRPLVISLASTSNGIPWGLSAGKTSGYAAGGDIAASATLAGSLVSEDYIVSIKGLLGMITVGAPRVLAVLDQSWGDPPSVVSSLDQSWVIRFGADLQQRWSDAPIIKSLLHQPWGNAGVIKAQLVQRWRDMVTLRAALDQPWAIMESLLVSLEQPWAITSGPVQALLDQGWNIRDVEQVMAVLHQPWSIASDGTVLRYTVTVLADGQPVRVSHINIEGGFDDSGDVLTCELHLATEAEYLLCPFGAELAVTITSQEGTDSFAFVVVSPKPSEAHGNNAWAIEAMSPAVMLGAPYADVIDGELSGLASEIAATLAGDVALSWETVDWHIPAATWIASGETPLTLLKTLATAVGALVQSDPDGTIAIRPRYPVSLPQWSSATPGHVFTEPLDCFENGATPEHRYGYNRFLVSNQSSSANSLTLEQADISGSIKEVRGYQVPWDGLFDLTHTGGPWVIIEPLGVEERDETETIEFVAGAGKVRYPLHGLVSVAWQQTNLGTITTAEDGSLTASISGQSLCEITYTTRCRLWKVMDSNNEQLQLVAEL